MAVTPQWVLGASPGYPQQTQTRVKQCCYSQVSSQLSSPPHPAPGQCSSSTFLKLFKRHCSGFSPAGQGADELRPGSMEMPSPGSAPQHPPLTKTFLFPLVNSLKASMTCSFVRVFLKSRFTVPSSFLKRRDRAELDGEGGSWGRSRVSAAMHVAKQDVTSVSGSCRICLCSRGEQRQQVSACTSQVIPQPQCIDLYANRTPHIKHLPRLLATQTNSPHRLTNSPGACC